MTTITEDTFWQVVNMNSLEVRVFSQSIRNYVEQSPLPAEVKRYVLADIFNELNKQADDEIAQQLQESEGK